MNEIFGYCGWDFGGARNNEFQRGEDVRIGRNIYRVVFRIGSWHLLKRISKRLDKPLRTWYNKDTIKERN